LTNHFKSACWLPL